MFKIENRPLNNKTGERIDINTMNATLLYTKLSLDVLNLHSDYSDEKLANLMKNDRGFYKLRSFLLCRACRELCLEPYCSNLCSHLVCKQCLEEKKSRNVGCKWCRNEEDLYEDVQGKILVGLYKQLCAILKDNIADQNNTGMPGTSSNVREKFIKFLDEGCSLPDFVVPQVPSIEEDVIDQPRSGRNNRRGKKSLTKIKECPPCCCQCGKSANSKEKPEDPNCLDISNDPVKIKAAQSSEERIKDVHKSPEYASDNVSSTVPDTAPTVQASSLSHANQNNNKDGGQSKKDNKIRKIKHNKVKEILKKKKRIREKRVKVNNDSALTKPFEEPVKAILEREKDIKSIYEKYGLNPNDVTKQVEDSNISSRKTISTKEKKKKHAPVESSYNTNSEHQTSPKIQPLKLTVQKINNHNNDVRYKIQYNSSSDLQPNDAQSDSDIEPEDGTELSGDETYRKIKRKATFVTNYALFSDESDFEMDSIKKKRFKKPPVPKESRETCGCGAGSNIKFFKDICKRSRCPCFSQGKACVNCKCRFCSNPFLLEDEIMYSDNSESSHGNQDLWMNTESVDVDVETM